jgi:hypothetical protein
MKPAFITADSEMMCAFSEDRQYRYVLRRPIPLRQFGRDVIEGTCLFIMLNPSTADEVQNDPTVSRCVDYAKMWGYAALAVCNLFAFRTPHPVPCWGFKATP